MSSIFVRGSKLYAKVKVPDGEWKRIATGYDDTPEGRRDAEAMAAELESKSAAERASSSGGAVAMTVRRWIDEWSAEQCVRGVIDWKRNRSWLVTLVVPTLGNMLVRDVRTPHVVELFKRIRTMPSELTGKARAPRTLHNIHGVARSMFHDAELAGHTEHAPAPLDERQLGRKVDANPEWRASALFTRDEVRALISSAKVPPDRRMVYAIELLAGTRPGEAAALRWKHYDPAKKPLGGLRIALSYSAKLDREKGTKTDAVKHVPVHPTLAAMLAEWRLTGWAAMMGREPTTEDLIVPMPPADAAARTNKSGEGFRPDYYSRRRWLDEDLPALGWRHRRHYDTRATFISIAVDDGSDANVIRDRVTHTKPMRGGFDFYDRGDHWVSTCREVLKLNVTRLRDPDDNIIVLPIAVAAVGGGGGGGGGGSRDSDGWTKARGPVVVQSTTTRSLSATSGLRRRGSNPRPGG